VSLRDRSKNVVVGYSRISGGRGKVIGAAAVYGYMRAEIEMT
jgi:hypothetical protein